MPVVDAIGSKADLEEQLKRISAQRQLNPSSDQQVKGMN